MKNYVLACEKNMRQENFCRLKLLTWYAIIS